MKLRNFLKNPKVFSYYQSLIQFFAKVKWQGLQALFNNGIYFDLLEKDHDIIRAALKTDYYIILTRRKCHLTTYIISTTSKLVTGKPTHWIHALMNVEGDITNNMDYKLIEATGSGVHWSTFMEVFDCDSVALLKPKGVPISEWTSVMDRVKKDYGKEYDLLFDITNDLKVSCVELIYQGLKKLPNFEVRFKKLITLIEENKGELTPQMLYDCEELEVSFEVVR